MPTTMSGRSRRSGRRLRESFINSTVGVFRRLLSFAVVHGLLSWLVRAGLLERIVERFPARLLALASLYWGNPEPVLRRYRLLLDGTARPRQAVRIAAALRLHGYVEEAQGLMEAFPEDPRAARERARIVASRYKPSATEFERLMEDRSLHGYVSKGRQDAYVVQRALPDHLHRRSGPEPDRWEERSPSDVCALTLEAFDALHSRRRPSPGDLVRHCLLLRQTLMDPRTEAIRSYVSARSLVFIRHAIGGEELEGVVAAASSGSVVALDVGLTAIDEGDTEALSYGRAKALYIIALAFGLFRQALRIRGVLIRMAAQERGSAPRLRSAWSQILTGTDPDPAAVARLLREASSARHVVSVADMAALAEDQRLAELCRSDWRFPDESELRQHVGSRPVLIHGPLEACADLPALTNEDTFLVLLGDYAAPQRLSDVPVGLRLLTKDLVSYRPESVRKVSGALLRGMQPIASMGIAGLVYLRGWPYGTGNALQRAAALALRADIGPITVGGGTLFLPSDEVPDYRRSVGTASTEGCTTLADLRALALPHHDPFFQFDYLRRGVEVGAFSVDSRLTTILDAGIDRYAESLQRQFG